MNQPSGTLVLILFIAALLIVSPSRSIGEAYGNNIESFLLYVPIPKDMSREAVVLGNRIALDRLRNLAQEHLGRTGRFPEDAKAVDRIIVFTDHDGRPILPDLEIATRRRAQITAANELTFTFNSPTYPWSAEELTTLTTTLNDCYAIAKAVYGDPAFNISVNVRKDPTISSSGLYFPSLNEIVLKSVSTPDPICHEMIHAFRDDDIISLASYEEGMTRAAEVEVFNRLPAYTHWDENHGYTYDVYYEGLNRQVIGSRGGNFFLGYVSVLLRYQLGGYAWAKGLLENATFLADFNRELYIRTLSDPTTTSTESKLLDIAIAVKRRLERRSFLRWYKAQGVLNTDPPTGYLLYQRINQFTVDFFFRDASGVETMQGGATIDWSVYDHQDTLLDSGSGVTSSFGWIAFYPVLPGGHTGRIKVVAIATSPGGVIRDTVRRFAGSEQGVFGIVENTNAGNITITPLADPTPPVALSVVNGAFSAPSLATVKGPFKALFTNTSGRQFRKSFTKDASAYFLSMPGR
jgi:hypothetical protein